MLGCPICRRRVQKIHEVYEREVRELPCFEFKTAAVIDVHRIRCRERSEGGAVELPPGKAQLRQTVRGCGRATCESAPARQIARRIGLAESTVRAIDRRYLERARSETEASFAADRVDET